MGSHILGAARQRGVDPHLAPKGSHGSGLSGASLIVRYRGGLAKIATTDNALIVFAIALLSLAVTSNSLWIDEAFTAWVVAHGSLQSVFTALTSSMLPTSDQQYPLYNLWIFAWTRIFGTSEYALRASNIPFGALFVISLSLAARLIYGRRFAWLPFAAAPFAWFYMNEARSYMMLLAFATAAAAALGVAIFGAPTHRLRATWIFLWSLLIALLVNILAILALPGILVFLVFGARDGWAETRGVVRTGLWMAPLFAVVLCYYAFTQVEPRAANIADNTRLGSSLTYTIASLYEQAGLAGIGPPRNAARRNPVPQIEPYLGFLVPAVLAYVVALVDAIRRKPDSATIAYVAAWITSFAFSALISYVTEARLLGRHIAAVLPFALLASIGLFRSRLALLLIAAVFVVSDLRLSLDSEYGKDDYRDAVNKVVELVRVSGGSVDWAADGLAANYYGLGLTYPKELAAYEVGWRKSVMGTSVADWDVNRADALVDQQLKTGAVYVVISKPDLYDAYGAWERVAQRSNARLVAKFESFAIYVLENNKQR